jgi:hypothetical protein
MEHLFFIKPTTRGSLALSPVNLKFYEVFTQALPPAGGVSQLSFILKTISIFYYGVLR